ncbi:hypothetical protein OESDEN_08030 [Oesophagostomum dentatum]|uniref:Uncharacterized protein n=1 Tax=Oesophagostomum dentatum TaxID=61180 RepID=A0A0B1T9R1_OESDE|nr:hypothetical protein OESDEN_08030 [Oesophagostomum dentatum]
MSQHFYLRAKDQLFTARVEELSPLFSIKIPEKYLKKYPKQRSNIGANANRLTSTTDVALTLMDIASSGAVVPPKDVERARAFPKLKENFIAEMPIFSKKHLSAAYSSPVVPIM